MAENKSAKTPADDGQPDAWCNGMPAYEGPLSKEQHKHLVPIEYAFTPPVTEYAFTPPGKEWARIDKDMNVTHLDMELCAKGPHNAYTALAMAIWDKAIETEREACAKLAEEPYEFTSEESHRIAAAIRARS